MGSPKLFDHPNFTLRDPSSEEDQITYALTMAAHLMSPPKLKDENYAITCEDAAEQIMALAEALKQRWSDTQFQEMLWKLRGD